jgi:hypothetical protein
LFRQQDLLGAAALVAGHRVRIAEQPLDRRRQAVEAPTAGVHLVPVIRAAHRLSVINPVPLSLTRSM